MCVPNINKKWFYAFAILGLAIVYIAGLFIDLIDIDATQYGAMSAEMLRYGNWLQVKEHLHDYLDKPPLLFWLSALSFKIFGIANWSYKLPSLLFSLLAFYSTYRFAKLYYNEQVARISALLLASCQAYVLFNNDVRTDALLTGAAMFAVWQLAEYLKNNKWLNLLGASVGIALALLAKGPIGLMVPILGFATDWICKRQWRNFIKPQWLVLLALVAAFIAPMLYGLYQQQGFKGWYFFFWAQSFGRLTGQNDFVKSTGSVDHEPLFFVHTFLWSFIPWSLLFIIGYWKDAVALFKSRVRIPENSEVITLAGFTLTFIGLSMSDYKLPYYIYVVFPFAAIIAAKGLDSIDWQTNKAIYIRVTHNLMGLILTAAAWYLCAYIFPLENDWLYALLVVFTMVYFASANVLGEKERIIFPALLGFIVFNIAVNLQGYPSLLKYQSTSQVGKYAAANHIPEGKLHYFKVSTAALDFYGRRMEQFQYQENELQTDAVNHDWIYTNQEGLNQAIDLHLPMAHIDTFVHYRASKLSIGFLNPKTRTEHTDVRYLIKF